MLRALIALVLLAAPALAAPPHVVTSIAPVQGIVADIMQGAGTPVLLLDEPMSPHDFSMRPSQRRAIARADVVFYVGLQMESWLVKPLAQQDSLQIPLGEKASPVTLPARELTDFGGGLEEHDEGPVDPHVWLDPANVLIWIDVIAGVLGNRDPDNAELYRANADALRAKTLAAMDRDARLLAPLKDVNLIVTHDSLQYFEHAFGLHVTGAFSASDGQKTGARNASRLLASVTPGTCIIEDTNEPNPAISALPDEVRKVAVDPLGFDLLAGGDYYPRLLDSLARALRACTS